MLALLEANTGQDSNLLDVLGMQVTTHLKCILPAMWTIEIPELNLMVNVWNDEQES